MSKKKKTIGAIAQDSMKVVQKPDRAIDIAQDGLKDYMKELRECAERGYERFKKDFFIEVLTVGNEILYNVIRLKFIDRQDCPTPNYDQSVFKVHYNTMEIEYVWTVPDRETCFLLLHNKKKVVAEEGPTLNMVLAYAHGDLFKLMKKLNNEKADTPELIN